MEEGKDALQPQNFLLHLAKGAVRCPCPVLAVVVLLRLLLHPAPAWAAVQQGLGVQRQLPHCEAAGYRVEVGGEGYLRGLPVQGLVLVLVFFFLVVLHRGLVRS